MLRDFIIFSLHCVIVHLGQHGGVALGLLGSNLSRESL